ncbi:LysR family transcriptional regulator [Phaeobacter gallaeciensis]|jgi:DNA-binding transcriptional LysR family regulator|uniref:LysR family transcriptional regulator n=1 Tax=Phaeobacter gallaeciensis TaxID=60890 RepID=A0A1B0ZV61_9RHOB|nr:MULTISPECIES: LysR family transcriptional regulator [Phaeobacter]MDF1773047.1 LysR family transcriptional regulator [Pseudophaeobacter sp. bin_em_oilr2.035]MEE2633643.1 LysR family transcriptional regulator [Pseudomonadota bacterium]ANP38066.1 LysR family transcriptional regulator [Phaeobacter gallaeciensis]MDE4063572.1 LysR family transcriptional regulator [Phaeobacter gallaeciensis]MDE4126584.1 LysR family transcriptional regulator [Phaeobacter gallaeciensis]
MIELKDLQLLTALARHQHFAKAAQECGMSQPAFSMRIRNLEDKLGVSIVRRGNRFQGLTGEGELIVARGRSLLDDARALEQEIAAARGQVTGTLDLGVVPTATSFAARLVNRLQQAHPRILARINVMSSAAIQQRLFEGTLDAGLTYMDSIEQNLVIRQPLYDERYVVLAPVRLVAQIALQTGEGAGEISWAQAAELPLSLLDQSMQNRRILDWIFAEQGLRPEVLSESSGFMSAIIMAREGLVATILPQALADALGPIEGTRVLRLEAPEQARPICMATLDREPELTTVRALRDVVAAFEQ